jgi:hypothetical protein
LNWPPLTPLQIADPVPEVMWLGPEPPKPPENGLGLGALKLELPDKLASVLPTAILLAGALYFKRR